MREVFSDKARVRRWLKVEAALARVEGRLGIIPEEAAQEIAAKAETTDIDLAALRAGTERAGFPIIALVDKLTGACAGEHGQYVHWGATTQDIMDTALVLQVRDGLKLIEADLGAVSDILRNLARHYRDAPMAGRTHLQHALPITFGYKAAVWLGPVERHRERLAELRPRVLVGQFGGAVGTLASLGADGLAVHDALMEEIGLGRPAIAWHAMRDALVETVCFLALVCGTLTKIATDVMLMTQTEVAEAFEPFAPGRGASSTMPQKRNPIACELIVAASNGVRHQAAAMLEAMVHDHERGSGPWHAEWLALPPAFVLAAGALAHSRTLLSGLEVDTERMRRNLAATGGLIVAEAVMMALAPHIGRQRAHDVVYAACREAEGSGASLRDVLARSADVSARLDDKRLDALLDPENYTGSAADMVERLLASLE